MIGCRLTADTVAPLSPENSGMAPAAMVPPSDLRCICQRLVHPSAQRDCLIIPERSHCGLPKEVRTEPEALFRRNSCPTNVGAQGGPNDLSDSLSRHLGE